MTGLENTAQVSVKVRHVDASTLAKAATKVSIALSGSGLKRTVTGKVSVPAATFPLEAFPLAGKVRVTWEILSNGRFKVRHKDSADAALPYTLPQRLAGKGRWRVRVAYDAKTPYAASASKAITFTVH